jgi:molybdopterin-containing oxidoreductase family iron-sulfur binding subunit
MNRHIQVESTLSLTGSNADTRILVKPSQEAAALAYLYNVVASKAGAQTVPSSALDEKAQASLTKVANELWVARGRSLVVSGSNNMQVQLIANQLNTLLDNYGKTIDLNTYSNQRQGDDAEMDALVKELGAGDALIIFDCNPAYSYAGRDAFNAALGKVKLSVSLNPKADETTKQCKYSCPNHHYLESWNDAEPKAGYYSITPPTIAPLFKTRSAAESLLKWAGNDTPYYDYIRAYWNANVFPKQTKYASFDTLWDRAVHDGVFDATAATVAASSAPAAGASLTAGSIDLSAAGAAIGGAAEGTELVLYEKIAIRDGKYSDNPWLQEAPDPVSKVVWDNYVCVSQKTAVDLNLKLALDRKKESSGNFTDIVKVSASHVACIDTAWHRRWCCRNRARLRQAGGQQNERSRAECVPVPSIQPGILLPFC